MIPCDCEGAGFGQHTDECISNKMAEDRRRYRGDPSLDKARTVQWYERQAEDLFRCS